MARTRYVPGSEASLLRTLPAAALRAVLREGYGKELLRRDLLAGAVVGVVALPLSMALAIAVGVPPQHGLYTAIIGGLLTPLLGGSRFQVTGPTAAFIVILAPIHIRFGLSGLFLAGAMAGLLLIAMGLLRLGKLIQFIPYPVTSGFTAGIGTVIAFLQLKDLLGLKPVGLPEHFVERLHALIEVLHTANLAELFIGLFSLAMLLLLPKVVSRVPAPLLMLPVAALAALLLHQLDPNLAVATIGSRFKTEVDGVLVAGIPRLPPLPIAPWNAVEMGGQHLSLTLGMVRQLLPSALAIALLGAIESLLSAVVADGMKGTRHDPDAELLALGVGNVVGPFFGAIPATGAIARTATAIRYGARSPIASAFHALVVLAAVLLLAPLIAYLPMASLAALLLLVAWNMSEVKHFLHVIKVAPKSDVAVLLACYALTVLFDMVVAVTVGMLLASMLFMRRMADVASVSLVADSHPRFQVKLPKKTLVYEINGPLFFGAAEKAVDALKAIGSDMKVLVLYFAAVPAMDVTGLVALESALQALERQGVLCLLTALQAQPLSVLRKSGLRERTGILQLCPTLEDAAAAARAHVEGLPPSLPSAPRPPGEAVQPGPGAAAAGAGGDAERAALPASPPAGR
jgi:sulfate permease, SulP family